MPETRKEKKYPISVAMVWNLNIEEQHWEKLAMNSSSPSKCIHLYSNSRPLSIQILYGFQVNIIPVSRCNIFFDPVIRSHLLDLLLLLRLYSHIYLNQFLFKYNTPSNLNSRQYQNKDAVTKPFTNTTNDPTSFAA